MESERKYAQMEVVHQGLSTAYIIFSFILGLYAAILAGRNVPISGEFWGTMWTNTGLAVLILIAAVILTATGKEPIGIDPEGSEENIPRVLVYYLYAAYFIISLPGAYAIMRGNDTRVAALVFSFIGFFNAAAAYSAIERVVTGWE
jgi:hypothetical protein